jgi:hypothetical protein
MNSTRIALYGFAIYAAFVTLWTAAWLALR